MIMKKMMMLGFILIYGLMQIAVAQEKCSCSCETKEKTPGVNMFDDLLETAVYDDSAPGKKKLVDQDYLLMMQVGLMPGQKIPAHNADSNVNIIMLAGKVIINLAGREFIVDQNDRIPVVKGCPMNIENRYEEKACFLIIKTPNPKKLEKENKTEK